MLRKRWKLLAGAAALIVAAFGARKVPALLRVAERESPNYKGTIFSTKGGDYR